MPFMRQESIYDWLSKIITSNLSFKMNRLAALLWSIWKTQNNLCFTMIDLTKNHSIKSKQIKLTLNDALDINPQKQPTY